MGNTLTPLCIFLLIVFYWSSYSCVLRIMVLILKQVKEILYPNNAWLFILTLIKAFYCTGAPLNKAKLYWWRRIYSYTSCDFPKETTHIKRWRGVAGATQLKISNPEWLSLKNIFVWHNYTCVGRVGWIYHDSPQSGSKSCTIKCSQLQHLLETKQKQKFLQFPQLCFVTQYIYSRSRIGQHVPKYCMSSASKYDPFLGF